MLSALFGDYTEAVAILAVLVINTGLGFVTELKAERSMEALRAIGSHMQRVRRGGKTLMVPAEDLVPGDILLLEAGDVAAADARLTAAANLAVDKSALTGESVPVEKSTEPVDRDAPVADRRCMLFKGTALTRGCAIAVVTATGMATELGRVAHLAARAAPEPSPLTRNLAQLSTQLVVLTIAIAALVAVAGIARGQSAILMTEAAIALAVAAIPEGLPIVATLVLARGMWRMAAKNALIERLSAVETLGATTVIFTDKTGTLTENRMAVRRIITPSQQLDIAVDRSAGPDAIGRRLLEVATLCNDAVIDGPGQSANGDPLEIALLRASRSAGIERPALLAGLPEIARRPFDSETRLMATVHADGRECADCRQGRARGCAATGNPHRRARRPLSNDRRAACLVAAADRGDGKLRAPRAGVCRAQLSQTRRRALSRSDVPRPRRSPRPAAARRARGDRGLQAGGHSRHHGDGRPRRYRRQHRLADRHCQRYTSRR